MARPYVLWYYDHTLGRMARVRVRRRSDPLGTLATMPATRLMPTEEGQDLIDLTREICDKELRPKVDDAERAAATDESFPTEVFRTLGAAGLLSLPHPEEFGGYGQPYEVYLQVVEEIA